jgi:phytoene/squalene synthetase
MSAAISVASLRESGTALSSGGLAEAITKKASRQSYYTIRLLADRAQVANAYRAYAYFRWVDDQVDERGGDLLERLHFVNRQKSLLEACSRGETPAGVSAEEGMLVELILSGGDDCAGLWAYLTNMMAVMSFDASRRGRPITEHELAEYTRCLAVAVTEALHHFIGRGCAAPSGTLRYAAVTGAHITHMLRDAVEDLEAGYTNVPLEYLRACHLDPEDVHATAYVRWVESRVRVARRNLRIGLTALSQLGSRRCRLAGYAYIARFLAVLNAIERDEFRLRPSYPERRGLRGAAAMIGCWLEMLSRQPGARADEWVSE